MQVARERIQKRAGMYKTDIQYVKYMKERSPTEKMCIKSSWWSKTSTNNQTEATVQIQKTPAHKTSKWNKRDNLMFSIYSNYKQNPQVDQKQRLSVHYSFGWQSSRDKPMQAQRSSSNPFATSALERGGWSVSIRLRTLYPQERPVPIVQEDGWALGPVG